MTMTDPTRGAIEPEDDAALIEARETQGRHFALEICFLAFIGAVTVVALLEATTYKLVSSRTPFVIMVPLLVLIVVHARRLWRVRDDFSPGRRIRAALGGQTEVANKVFGFSAWLVALTVAIIVFGHLAGVFLFCVVLMHFVADERWGLTLAVAAATTLFVWGVFEVAFDVELYRGLIIRYFMGYRDF